MTVYSIQGAWPPPISSRTSGQQTPRLSSDPFKTQVQKDERGQIPSLRNNREQGSFQRTANAAMTGVDLNVQKLQLAEEVKATWKAVHS